MHAAILNYNKLQSGFLSKCVFSNIDRTHHHSVLKLIFAINNLANDNGKKTLLLIVYNAKDHPICLNDWEDEHYFTREFLMLFLFRDGGHLVKCQTVISLQVWVNWAIEYHNYW